MSKAVLRSVDRDGTVYVGSEWAGKVVRIVEVDEHRPCLHLRTIVHPGDETTYPRTGCLDCDQWLTPVRLRNP